ncbi:acyltransferase family protein [Nitrospirota bacterium]
MLLLLLRSDTGTLAKSYFVSAVPADSINKRAVAEDVIRGIAIINVIFIHTVWFSGQLFIANDLIRQIPLAFEVPLFFVISGLLASTRNISVWYYCRRLINLYVPYLIMILFLTVIYFTANNIIISSSTFTNLLSLNIIPEGRNLSKWVAVVSSLWFLQVFIILQVFSPILNIIMRYKSVNSLVVLGLLALILSSTFRPVYDNNYWVFGIIQVQYVIFYTFFYLLGGLMKTLSFEKIKYIGLFIFVLVINVAMVSQLVPDFNFQRHKFPPNALFLVYSLFSVLLLMLARGNEQLLRKYKNNVLIRFTRTCGKNSYSIYLYQGFGATIIIPIAEYLKTGNVALVLCIVFVINLAASLSLSNIFHMLNEIALQQIYQATGRLHSIFKK